MFRWSRGWRALATTLLIWAQLAPARGADLLVVTTTEDLAAIAREVGGDRIEVESIARGTEDPHFVAAKPSYMVKLREADLFVQVGLDLEIGWVPLLLEGSRNRNIQPGNAGYVDASTGITALEVPAVATRAAGDVHPYGNPHYWLDPENGIAIARSVLDGLTRVDSPGRPAYEASYRSFEERLRARIAEWQDALRPLQGAHLVSYHRAWVYFEQRFGLRFVGELEPKPGIPPSPRHLAELSRRIEAGEVDALVHGPYYNPKPVVELGRRTGLPVVPLPLGVGGAPGVATYFDLFDYIVSALRRELGDRPLKKRAVGSPGP
jgi:ABC-type Zn uptake system ZnuABC Zn-binding protein ZnuA